MATGVATIPLQLVRLWSVYPNLFRGGASSQVKVLSLQPNGPYNHSMMLGPKVGAAVLATTHLHGERLDLDHGYPVRLIAPNRPGVLNTKWLRRVEVSGVRKYRVALGVPGALLLTFGLFRLVTQLDTRDLFALVLWLAAAAAPARLREQDFIDAAVSIVAAHQTSSAETPARRIRTHAC